MGTIYRPTFIGIHMRDESTQVLYVSSGCRQAMGYTPAQIIAGRARDFIADPYGDYYPQIYESKVRASPSPTPSNNSSSSSSNGSDGEQENDDDDEANAYVMYMNIKHSGGVPVLHRITSFKCDSCVVVVGMAFPEVPFCGRSELEVQMLDGAMKRIKFGSGSNSNSANGQQQQQQRAGSLYYAPSRQIKVAMMLENPQVSEVATEAGRRPNGPLVVFVTGAVNRLVDADTSDLLRFPFLKLVAPEDVLRTCAFFDRLAEAPETMFETFSLLARPPVNEGDLVVDDAENPRVVVECLGATTQDGVALFLKRLRTELPPSASLLLAGRKAGGARRAEGCGYLSLEDLLSSDPETSDAPNVWTRLR
ncbi:hypothetical protein GGF37_003684 [Kickxella alabastrina]|nr:hypothetical protein GGF37_003684 [Kickxella alabastrina]